MTRALRILSLAALLFAADANAVYVNPNGAGQALIYPYYTASSAGGNPFNTYVSIVNHSRESKSLRVRFREGRNGREVLAFNLLLEGPGAWAGAVVPFGDGTRLLTTDASCANSGFSIEIVPGSPPFKAFSSASYTGANADGHGEGLDRTREGFVEVIEMASIRFTDAVTNAPLAPPTCDDFRAERLAPRLAAPTGGLSGTLTLINVLSGMDFTANAEALADLASQQFHRAPSDPYPAFDVGEIDRVAAFIHRGRLYRAMFGTGLEAVEAALMRTPVMNEVVLDSATRSSTDWIVTFPTKHFHGPSNVRAPFHGGGDVRYRLEFTPRDASPVFIAPECDFMCAPGFYVADLRLPWTSTAVSFRAAQTASAAAGTSEVVGSRNGWIVNLPTSAANGFARMDVGSAAMSLRGSSLRVSDATVRPEESLLWGRPVVGMMLRTFRNDTLNCAGRVCQGNYGGSFPHKYERTVAP